SNTAHKSTLSFSIPPAPACWYTAINAMKVGDVLPSGAAFLTTVTPMRPAPPVRFSTTAERSAHLVGHNSREGCTHRLMILRALSSTTLSITHSRICYEEK